MAITRQEGVGVWRWGVGWGEETRQPALLGLCRRKGLSLGPGFPTADPHSRTNTVSVSTTLGQFCQHNEKEKEEEKKKRKGKKRSKTKRKKKKLRDNYLVSLLGDLPD